MGSAESRTTIFKEDDGALSRFKQPTSNTSHSTMSSYAITGAGRGMGYEFVDQLSTKPDNTVFAIIRTPSTATKLQELAQKRKNLHIVTADVSDPKAMLAAAQETSKITGGSLDVLIHNANSVDAPTSAFSPSKFSLEDPDVTYAAFNEAFKTTLYGTLWTTNAFIPLIEKGKQKKIIHISTGLTDVSLIRTAGFEFAVPYTAAKSTLNVISAKYAVELKEKGIKVLTVSPGWVDTYEGPANPQMEAFQSVTLSKFQRVKPDLKGPIQPQESVRKQLELIGRLDEELSGKFVSHHGDQNWF